MYVCSEPPLNDAAKTSSWFMRPSRALSLRNAHCILRSP